ncbi:MAG: leucine/isoleucine/valine transporter permease subunit [Anaerolineae bacterium]|nr:leucine/isoleucine/valine transporter permease subunit [Anaerolineae bacterium]
MKHSNLRNGWVGGIVNIFLILLGLTGLAGTLLQGWLGLPSPAFGVWVSLLGVVVWSAARATKASGTQSWREALAGGALSGLLSGGIVGLLVGLLATLDAGSVEIRQWLVQLTPEAIALLTFGVAPWLATLLVAGVHALAGLLGSALYFAAITYQWQASVKGVLQDAGHSISQTQVYQRIAGHPSATTFAYAAGAILLLTAPLYLGRYWNYTLGTVGLYVILGLGLNIVVGMAGQLVLGYGAFFAIGAYTVALLTAPTPHGIMMNFWLVVPIGVILAALSGVVLGLPVLRMRGDYLAIVTLGFGEIIRILLKSDALIEFTGGPRGVRAVGGPSLFGIKMNNEFYFTYFIIIGIILAAYITAQLQKSRVGRAWMAIRGDEDVAEAMGIMTLKYKLLAFAIAAGLAGLSGVLFASRNKFTGPEDFTLLVSINVLSLVIIGGMGSIPGVIMGALILKGLPEILRELSDYRMLAFGALLVLMMILRPEGMWPSTRQKMELHGDEEKAETSEHTEPARGVA